MKDYTSINTDIKSELDKLREELIADGQECSEVKEVEEGVFEIIVGGRRDKA
jgi:hypothetical protein